MKKKSVYTNKRAISAEELRAEKNEFELRKKLGISYDYDESCDYTEKEFLNVSTLYKSVKEYQVDKLKASIIINNGGIIPSELHEKLSITRNELAEAGLI